MAFKQNSSKPFLKQTAQKNDNNDFDSVFIANKNRIYGAQRSSSPTGNTPKENQRPEKSYLTPQKDGETSPWTNFLRGRYPAKTHLAEYLRMILPRLMNNHVRILEKGDATPDTVFQGVQSESSKQAKSHDQPSKRKSEGKEDPFQEWPRSDWKPFFVVSEKEKHHEHKILPTRTPTPSPLKSNWETPAIEHEKDKASVDSTKRENQCSWWPESKFGPLPFDFVPPWKPEICLEDYSPENSWRALQEPDTKIYLDSLFICSSGYLKGSYLFTATLPPTKSPSEPYRYYAQKIGPPIRHRSRHVKYRTSYSQSPKNVFSPRYASTGYYTTEYNPRSYYTTTNVTRNKTLSLYCKPRKKDTSPDPSHSPLLHLFQHYERCVTTFTRHEPVEKERMTKSRNIDKASKLQIALQKASVIDTVSDSASNYHHGDRKMPPQLMGRQKIAHWKAGVGGSKDWRRCSYTQVPTKRQRQTQIQSTGRSTSKPFKAIEFISRNFELGGYRVNTSAPAIIHKIQEAQLSKISKRKYKYKYIKNFGLFKKRLKHKKTRDERYLFEDTLLIKTDMMDRRVHRYRQEKFSTSPTTSFQECNLQIQSRAVASDENAYPQDASLPLVFHRLGEIINCQHGLLRLMEHICTDTHGEVYGIEDLNSGVRYETKIYILRGTPPNQRKRRVDNLKKLTASSSFRFSFDHNGRKYCVYLASESMAKNNTAKLGAIGRRNTPEYDEAFPKLPSSIPYISTNTRQEDPPPAKIIPEASLLNVSEEVLFARETLQVVQEEVLNCNSDRWSSYHQQLPLASRLIIRLTELNPSWREEANLLAHSPPLHTIHESISSQNKSKRGRKKRAQD